MSQNLAPISLVVLTLFISTFGVNVISASSAHSMAFRELSQDAQNLLELAKSSPNYALNHEKENWLNLFSVNGVVNDPVGAPSHTGLDRIGLFYDTFISPNKIVFDEFGDWVDLNRRKVYRDVDIHITFPNGGIQVQPAHLKYIFDDQGRVLELNAHWNFLNGWPEAGGIGGIFLYGIGASKAFYNIFALQGLGFGSNYLNNMGWTVLSKGSTLSQNFVKALNAKNWVLLGQQVENPWGTTVDLPGGVEIETAKLGEVLERMHVDRIDINEKRLFNSGHVTTAALQVTVQGEVWSGMGVFTLDKTGMRIAHVELIW